MISSSNLYLSFALLRLYRACLHVGHARKSLYSPRYNIQSFTQACIFCTSSSNGQTIFFASFVLLGSTLSSGRISFKRPNISVKPLFDRPFAALNLRSARVALNLEYFFLQPGYNSFLESASMVGRSLYPIICFSGPSKSAIIAAKSGISRSSSSASTSWFSSGRFGFPVFHW